MRRNREAQDWGGCGGKRGGLLRSPPIHRSKGSEAGCIILPETLNVLRDAATAGLAGTRQLRVPGEGMALSAKRLKRNVIGESTDLALSEQFVTLQRIVISWSS